MDVRVIYRTYPACGRRFGQPDDPGRKRRFCSDACKQAAYRARKREREQARRTRDRGCRTPPPHAGSSRPAPTAQGAVTTAGRRRTPSTTTMPPTTAPGAATTACTPRPTAPASPRKRPPADPRPSSSGPSTPLDR